MPAIEGLVVDEVLPGRNRTKADVYLGRLDGRPVAVKDYARRPWSVRQTLGRWLVRRETHAYRRLADCPGIPDLVGRLGPFTLATARVSGRPVRELDRDRVDASVLDRLDEILGELHGRGVAHGDLHHRDVLVGDDGTVWVVDLATSFVRGRSPWSRALFARFAAQDRVAAARLRARFTGADEAAAIARVGAGAAARYRAGRSVRRLLDRLARRDSRRSDRAAPPSDAPALPDPPRAPLVSAASLRLAVLYVALAALVVVSRPTPLSVSAGFALVALGEAIRCWAAGHLRKTVELVTSGPYRYTRHPLYLGRLLILTGIAIMAWLPRGMTAVVLGVGWAGFFGYYMRRKERIESARLLDAHGEAFARYRDAVPALWPRLSPYAAGADVGWSSERLLVNREHWMIVGLVLLTLILLARAYHLGESTALERVLQG